MRKWADEATKTAVWEVYKFIHINTVAPFEHLELRLENGKDSTITSKFVYEIYR